MCYICGVNGGFYGDELICDKCRKNAYTKDMDNFLPKELQRKRYDKIIKNRYR